MPSSLINRTSKMPQITYPENFFLTNEWIYHISGIWLYNKPKISIFRRIYQFLWSLFLVAVSVYFLYLELIVFQETIHDMKKFFSQFGLLLTHIFGVFRVLLLLKQHERLLVLKGILQDENYYYEDFEEFQPGRMMNEAKWLSSKFSVLLFFMYSMVGVLSFISTEITLDIEIKEEKLPGNVTCYDYMPYYFVIPWDYTTKTNCRWANLLMSLALDTYAWVIACHDGVLAALLNCLKTQMLILCGAIRTIRGRILRRLNLPIDFQHLHDEEMPELEMALYAEVVHLNKHLAILLNVASEFEDIFTYITLCQTLSSLIIFASCMLVATSIPMTSPTFFSQSEYFCCVLLQFSVFCWFGSGVTMASEEVNKALYECDWYSASKRFKSCLVTTMCRMQRPVYLTIGKFSPLTLTAMVTVVKGSFSYYAVFKQVGGEL